MLNSIERQQIPLNGIEATLSNRYTAEQSTSSPPVISLAGDAVRNEHGRPVLVGSRCNDCGALSFPRVAVCVKCMSESFAEEPMPERGTLYSWTAVHVGPPHMHKPVTLGYVDLENGVRVFSHLASKGQPLAFNQPVKLTVAEVGRQADDRPIETFVFIPAGDAK
jgi:uncharacterized OB-fold protein